MSVISYPYAKCFTQDIFMNKMTCSRVMLCGIIKGPYKKLFALDY